MATPERSFIFLNFYHFLPLIYVTPLRHQRACFHVFMPYILTTWHTRYDYLKRDAITRHFARGFSAPLFDIIRYYTIISLVCHITPPHRPSIACSLFSRLPYAERHITMLGRHRPPLSHYAIHAITMMPRPLPFTPRHAIAAICYATP